MFPQNPRPEQTLFEELEQLCSQPGYIHAIANFCLRDNMVTYVDEVTTEDMLKSISHERLIRTEISTLIGLMIKADIDFSLPSHDELVEMISKTESLLNEIHATMIPKLDFENILAEEGDPFSKAAALREPIFYCGESAYVFQYRDLAVSRYKNDNAWFIKNKGFSVYDAQSIIKSISENLNEKIQLAIDSLVDAATTEWTPLPGFEVSANEISKHANIDVETVNNFLQAFTLSPKDNNSTFISLSDFNAIYAYPIIKHGDNYIIFQIYGLSEALYDTPFYWFTQDNEYCQTAMRHRGVYTEEFSLERLRHVFGVERVHSNIDILDKSGNKAGEIDVLVTYADRAIVLQAKSKKLTILSRKGNDRSLQDDFKKAVQDSYDQALSCAEFLTDSNYTLKDAKQDLLNINRKYTEIFPICVISEHYPALSFQTRRFLKYKETEIVRSPFVMDVFNLDAMTEMLDSPLYFLSYVKRRTGYTKNVLAENELTILAYHLAYNLTMPNDIDNLHLGDDLAASLDIAMTARREGLPGAKTPDGILTHFKGTTIEQLIDRIQNTENQFCINLGFLLLEIGEDTIKTISNGIDQITKQTQRDHKTHDLSVEFNSGDVGLTIHSNYLPRQLALEELTVHCELKKYDQKVARWLGMSLHPVTLEITSGVELNNPWKHDALLDKALRGRKKQAQFSQKIAQMKTKRKIGRNERCPCGSGKKYKKCCGK